MGKSVDARDVAQRTLWFNARRTSKEDDMHIPLTMHTAAGPRLASPPDASTIPPDPAVALAKAALLERMADLHQSEGRTWHADRLSHLALELRCRAAGQRA